jgi:phenylacetate-coenzyme A ligase PaaK-like adenylate-forming protein
LSDYPLGDDFTLRLAKISRDALFDLQNQRFQKLMARAWQIPFYQRLWSAKGLVPADISGLQDITRLPTLVIHTPLTGSLSDNVCNVNSKKNKQIMDLILLLTNEFKITIIQMMGLHIGRLRTHKM